MKIYKDYFQKSKIFLYPLLEIQKGIKYVPINTYMAWEGQYSFEDSMLMCIYKQKCTKAFAKFEEFQLLNHKYLEDYRELGEDLHLYVFDLSMYKKDIQNIIKGTYSKMRKKTKTKILDFFGDIGPISEYIESYIYPQYYHEDYANELNVKLEDIEKVWELCSKPDLEKENLKIKIKELNIIKEKSISLLLKSKKK
jgi:hypothetical protein